MPLHLPAPDHATSALTGWTRAHWESCADHLIAGGQAHTSPAGARVRFPSSRAQDATDELEGFARCFLLSTLRIGGKSGDSMPDLTQRLAAGLAAGADPRHHEAWPTIGHHDQTLVEATAIAVGLHWSRPQLWDQLPDTTRDRLVDWLSGARGKWCADNNHVLFGATVQAFLASVGADHDEAVIDGALARTDEWYAGDGWYSDGRGRRFDHYNAWTFHLYPFIIEQLLNAVPAHAPGTSAMFDVHRTRLRMFLDDYQYLFDASGGAVLQGRSLIYRFGMAAPFWMGELQGVSPLRPGRTRRLVSGMVSGFAEAGTLDSGVLNLGWKRPAADLLQSYNAPGSPLWASKGFLGLLLPAEHPAWQEPEEPLVLETSDVLRPVSGPEWLLVGRRSDGVIRLLNHGSDGHPRRSDPLYRRLGYSSATVPVQFNGLDDNTIMVGPREEPSLHRGLSAGVVHREGAASRFRLDAQGRDVVVDIATLVVGDAEVRLARLRGVLDQTVRCTGWAVSADAPVLTHTGNTWASATSSDEHISAMAWIDSGEESSSGVDAGPHQHALGSHVGLPWLEVDAGARGTIRLAWLVHLGQEWDPEVARGVHVRWTDDGADVTIDGRHHHCGWAGENRWSADDVNQGIFRVGSPPLDG